MDILPFVKQYWERIGCDVVVYDNGSTDGSIEFLQSLPYVTVKHFESEGQNDVIQKSIKEQAYMELKDQYDFIIISDMDEVFYFSDFEALEQRMIEGEYNILIAPIYALCEESKPLYDDSKMLHQLCHMFYKQKMNHMNGFWDYSKLSIFNCKITDGVRMSVGQHYVQTYPSMKILLSNSDFCLHIDKGFGISYKFRIRQKMNDNLSTVNKSGGMCVEYGKSFEALEKEYVENQKNSFDINNMFKLNQNNSK
jgi:hypothetical protein